MRPTHGDVAGPPRPSLARIDARARQAREPGGLDLIHVYYPQDVQALMLEITARDLQLVRLQAERDRALAQRDRAVAQLQGIGDTLSVIAGTLGSESSAPEPAPAKVAAGPGHVDGRVAL